MQFYLWHCFTGSAPVKLHFPLSNPQMTRIPTTFQIQNLYSLNIETVPNFVNEALNSIVLTTYQIHGTHQWTTLLHDWKRKKLLILLHFPDENSDSGWQNTTQKFPSITFWMLHVHWSIHVLHFTKPFMLTLQAGIHLLKCIVYTCIYIGQGCYLNKI
jgi:hypothetical protein